ncbi:TPA: hypothetical protein ACH3X3_006586 [Trebouxia sp. C0006]
MRNFLQALESAGHIGLTAAELNAQVLLLRTKDSDEAPLPPEVVAMYNKTTVTERSRLCRGAKGRLEDGRPLVEKLIPSPTSLFRYRLAPEHPSLAPPSALPVQAPELQPEVINPLSDSEDAEAESEGAEADTEGAGFDPEDAKEPLEDAAASSAEARAGSRDAGSVLQNAGPSSTNTRVDSAHPGDFHSESSLPTDLVINRSSTSHAPAALHAKAAAAAQQSTSMIELWPCSAPDLLPVRPAAPCVIAGFPLPTLPIPPSSPEESSAASPPASPVVSLAPVKSAPRPASPPASPPASLALSPVAPPAAFPAALPPPSPAPFSAASPVESSAATLAAPPWRLSADSPPVAERSADPGLVLLKQQRSEAIVPVSMPTRLQETLLRLDNLMAISPTAPSRRRCHSRAPLSLRLSPVSNLCLRLDGEEGESQDDGVDEPPASAAYCGCPPAADWFEPAAPLSEEQITHERNGKEPDWIVPDSLEQSSQDNPSQQPEQEDEHGTMQEGFCYVVGTRALAHQDTELQPDIAADSGVNSSTKQIHCQDERVKDLSDACVLCGNRAETLFEAEVWPTLQLDLQQAEAALQTSIKGDDSSKVDACKLSTQQGTSSLSAEAHTAGLCRAVPEASPRQHWGRSELVRAESDRAEPDKRLESDMAASAELPQVRRSGNKRKRQDDRADLKLEALCKRRQGADGLPWSQACRSLTSSICFVVLAVWLSFDLLD